ncbi:SU10 major capsid protein [Bacillus sp. JJ722]|uniref:SU10 major capsid protein n=1 Tax=Bacillus sp. JJ722 TaxID=3122973 RepID=UPI0030008F15
MSIFTSKDFAVGQNYDLKDVLVEVNKKNNTFTTFMLSKTVKATAPQVHWITEEIADSAVTLAEGGNAPEFKKDDLAPRSNYLELFANTAVVTNTAQYSTAKGISDLLAHEVDKKSKAIKRRIENKLLHGVQGYDATTKTYTTDGVITQIHADHKVTGELTGDKFEEMVGKLYDAGVSDNLICFLPARMKQTINKTGVVEFFARDKFLGFDAEEYITTFGTVRFVLCEELGNNKMFIVNPDYLEMPVLIPYHAQVEAVSGSKQSVFLETQVGVNLLNDKAAASFEIVTP